MVDFSNKPKTHLRMHLHTNYDYDPNIADGLLNSPDSQEFKDESFKYTLNCIREACAMAKRVQTTVWFEETFTTYVGQSIKDRTLYIGPHDEYHVVREWYYITHKELIDKYVSEEIKKLTGIIQNGIHV